MIYSKGISWIDDTRIPFVDEGDMVKIDMTKGKLHTSGAMTGGIKRVDAGNTNGRFTPNLLVSDDMLNDGSVSNSSGHIRNNKKPQTIYGGGKGMPPIKVEGAPSDKGTNSRYYDIDLWFNNMIYDIL